MIGDHLGVDNISSNWDFSFFSQGSGKRLHDDSLTGTSRANHHGCVTSKHGVIQLEAFADLLIKDSFIIMLETFFVKSIADGLLKIFVTDGFGLKTREQIAKKTLEKRFIIEDKLGHIHITKGTHKHNIFRQLSILTLKGTSHDQHGFKSTKSEIIMMLL
jgi:hypothetical protein